MSTLKEFVNDIIGYPEDARLYGVSKRLAETFPDKYILETEDFDFDLQEFAKSGRCAAYVLQDIHPQMIAEWINSEKGGEISARTALIAVRWEGIRLRVLQIEYGDCDWLRYYIIANTEEEAKTFFASVCYASTKIRGEVLVFSKGRWSRDKELLAQIAGSTLENLVLAKETKQALLEDIESFFDSEETYRGLCVAWKRGVLLTGPPGNGKTHAIKAMVNRLGRPCLYVRSFSTWREPVHVSIEKVFSHARKVAPCMLILEDLESMVDKTNRSFFLNEMDGFASNHGILTVASTNYPEKLDPAITARPSRFDRKIEFRLPRVEERQRYLALLNENRSEDMRLTQDQVVELARVTRGFSFAYLKELFLSGTMAWMRHCRPGGMAECMQGQIHPLRAQMKTTKSLEVKADEDDE